MNKIFLVFLLAIAIAVSHSITVCAGCNDGPTGPTITEEHKELFKYHPNNPKNIAPGSSEDIRVIEGTPPYSWTTDNPEYTFTDSQTIQADPEEGRENPLTAGINACGQVKVTVTDSTDVIAEGYLNKDFQPLEFRYDLLPDSDVQIPPGSSATIYISYGAPPYIYTLADPNFSFDPVQNISTVTTNDTSVIVYNINNGCGTDVTVTDQCGSTVNGYIRGTGQWPQSPTSTQTYPIDPNGCFEQRTEYPCLWYGNVYTTVNGNIKTTHSTNCARFECCLGCSAGPPLSDAEIVFLVSANLTRCLSTPHHCGSTAVDIYWVYSWELYYEWQCN